MMNFRDLTDRLSPQELARLFRGEPSPLESLFSSLALLGVGALIGATVALFLAPRPGAELREKLRGHLRSAGETLAEAVDSSPAKPRDV
jgi:hypothetical protein